MKSKIIKSNFVKKILRRFTKMYDTYKKVEDVFAEPIVIYKIGKWRNDPCLPVWRRGNYFKLFKKTIYLPIWISFHKFNHDFIWKTKYDEYRYEYPSQFTLVFFGLSISFWLRSPRYKEDYDDFYWEPILNYLYDNKDIIEYGKEQGIATYTTRDLVIKKYALDVGILKEPYKRIWQKYIDEHPIQD